MNTTVVEFRQYHNGVPVFRCGVSVLLQSDTGSVVQASNAFNYDVPNLGTSAKELASKVQKLDGPKMAELIELERNLSRVRTIREDLTWTNQKVTVNGIRETVYRYDPETRTHSHKEGKHSDRNIVERALEFSLPRVSRDLKAGDFRLGHEVFFTTAFDEVRLNWHSIVDAETEDLLYLRPLIDQASGYVFDRDPLTTTGDTSIVPSAATAVLNGPRNPRPMPGNPALPNLNGQYVQLAEIQLPLVAPPTSAAGTFDYNPDTDDFSGVNAYYHSDTCFRTVEEMGFNMATYFDGTAAQPGFGVPVDHRGCFACVNAAAFGNLMGDGIGFFTYGVLQAGQPVGFATSVRWVWHEFGHAILWDNVHSPNFGFAHSCGDSLGTLYCDPGSKAPDRFESFPWTTQSTPSIDRRHDRDVTAGWAWGGVNDDGSYGSEQILNTSHFRAYRAIGGDNPELCNNSGLRGT
jgi:hypothetical protein